MREWSNPVSIRWRRGIRPLLSLTLCKITTSNKEAFLIDGSLCFLQLTGKKILGWPDSLLALWRIRVIINPQLERLISYPAYRHII